MTSVDERGGAGPCTRCRTAIEECAFCQREECRELLCYRCVRILLGQQVSEPHGHGG